MFLCYYVTVCSEIGLHDPTNNNMVRFHSEEIPIEYAKKLQVSQKQIMWSETSHGKNMLVSSVDIYYYTANSIEQVMKYFIKYMDDTLIKGSDQENALATANLCETYMVRWLRTKESITMCLSTGTVQVIYLIYTKLLLGLGDFPTSFTELKL